MSHSRYRATFKLLLFPINPRRSNVRRTFHLKQTIAHVPLITTVVMCKYEYEYRYTML